MESVLVVAALLLILANLFIIMVMFLLVFRAFFKFVGEETLNNWSLESFIPKNSLNPFSGNSGKVRREEPTSEGNEYTPTEDVPSSNEVPLEDFVPNFDKPIKIKYEDAGEDHGMRVEEEEPNAQ